MATPYLLLHVTQVGASIYAAVLSYTAIVNLLKKEQQAEQAAKYSSTAAQELHKTRTTQTSGALAVSCPFRRCVVNCRGTCSRCLCTGSSQELTTHLSL